MKGTIKSGSDIERLFRTGRRSSSYVMTVIALQVREGDGRCAYIAGKKLGSAPHRSRCKRVLREAARELGAPWSGYNVALVAHRKAARIPHGELVGALARHLEKLGVR